MSDIEKCVPECAYREKITELQEENVLLKQLIRDVQIYMGTDDCDWDELQNVLDRIEEFGLKWKIGDPC